MSFTIHTPYTIDMRTAPVPPQEVSVYSRVKMSFVSAASSAQILTFPSPCDHSDSFRQCSGDNLEFLSLTALIHIYLCGSCCRDDLGINWEKGHGKLLAGALVAQQTTKGEQTYLVGVWGPFQVPALAHDKGGWGSQWITKHRTPVPTTAQPTAQEKQNLSCLTCKHSLKSMWVEATFTIFDYVSNNGD